MSCHFFSFFFFNDTATTEIYTLSLHDALPISKKASVKEFNFKRGVVVALFCGVLSACMRSEEHTSELQSLTNLVCRLLLEKKKKKQKKEYKAINILELDTQREIVRVNICILTE